MKTKPSVLDADALNELDLQGWSPEMQPARRSFYARSDWGYQHWRPRWERRVLSRTPRLLCQACGGAGGEIDEILVDGTGPFMTCGWCDGVGYVDGWRRGEWLRSKKEEAKA